MPIPIFDVSQPGQPRRDQILNSINWRANRPVPRVVINPHGQNSPISSHTNVTIEGWVPSSCNQLLNTVQVFDSRMLKRQEEFRADHNNPTVLLAHERDPSKYYAKWAGGYIEVSGLPYFLRNTSH